MNSESHRHVRIADLIQKELSHLIQFSIKDPRLDMVTVSGVNVSKDLSYAKVYITVLGDDEQVAKNIQILNKAASFLRRELAKTIQLRITPKLKFIYDNSVSQGNRISELIDKAVSDDNSSGDNS